MPVRLFRPHWFAALCVLMPLALSAAETAKTKSSSPEKTSLISGALRSAAKQGMYVFVLLYEGKGEKLTQMRHTLAKAKQQLAQKAVFVECPANSPEAEAFQRKHELVGFRFPLLVPVSSTGVVTHPFDYPPTVEQMRGAMLSLPFTKTIRAMREGKGVLAVFSQAAATNQAKRLAAVQAFAGDYKDPLVVVRADPTKNKDFAIACGITEPKDTPRLLIVLNGRILYNDVCPETKDGVAKAFETASSRSCGCCCVGGM